MVYHFLNITISIIFFYYFIPVNILARNGSSIQGLSENIIICIFRKLQPGLVWIFGTLCKNRNIFSSKYFPHNRSTYFMITSAKITNIYFAVFAELQPFIIRRLAVYKQSLLMISKMDCFVFAIQSLLN